MKWPTLHLSEACTLITDGTHHSPANGPSGAYRYITAKNIRPWGLDLSDVTWIDEKTHRAIYVRCPVLKGDVLYIKDGVTTGLAAINTLKEPFSLLSSVACLRPNPDVLDSAFLKHWLNSPETVSRMTRSMTGTAIKRLVLREIRDAQVSIPSLNEQRRIVAKLEALQARSRHAREALEAVPPLLEKLRQSILAAAFRGDLTKDWREKHPDVEPASELLKRIRIERRKKWEEAELARMKAKGKTPADDRWKAKYVEPKAVDAAGLPELPTGWCWVAIGDLFVVSVGATPSRAEAKYWNGDIPWVSSGEVAFCRIRSATEGITAAGLANSSTQLHPPGTVLIGMIGEGRTRGQAAILDIWACNNQNAAAIRVSESSIAPEYVFHYLRLSYEENRKRGSGNNQQALNKERVCALPFVLAPLTEQTEIVRRLDDAEARLARLASLYAKSRAQETELTRSILASAFRGELVPQDANDEPAEVMLARQHDSNATPSNGAPSRSGKQRRAIRSSRVRT